jgi:hypothetical protein
MEMEAIINVLKPKTLMAHVIGSQSTSSRAWNTYRTASVDPGNLFSSPAKDCHHRTISPHPDLIRLVTEEEETPLPPPSEEELELEVHHTGLMTSLKCGVESSSP